MAKSKIVRARADNRRAAPKRRLSGISGLLETFSGKFSELAGWASSDHRRAVVVLLIAGFMVLLPGFASFPVTPRDESRFAQPTKQMIETGNYIDIRLQEKTRYRKPVGIYWVQAVAVNAAETIGFRNARDHIAFYRLPSLLAVIGGMLLTYWTALAFVSRRYAMLAALALAASTLAGLEARIATIDATMMLTAVAAFGALAHAYFSPRAPVSKLREWGIPAVFWTAIACSILLKGPILCTIVGLALLMLLYFDRSASWLWRLKPAVGVLWLLALVLPWFLAIYTHTQGEFFNRSVSGDLMSRLLEPAEGHWGPPGYFWLLFWVSFWPAAVLAPLATAFAWKNRSESKVRFLIAWILPAWLMFEIVVTKLPHYVLPLYPGIAVLIAYALERRMLADLGMRLMGLLWPAFTVATAVGLYILASRFGGSLGIFYFVVTAVAILLSVVAARELFLGNAPRALVIALFCALANTIAFYGVIPHVRGLNFASSLAAAAGKAPCPAPKITSAGHQEPNLVFLSGTDLDLAVSGRDAADFMRQGGCRVAFVENREMASFRQQAAKLGLQTEKIGAVEGFDVANWRNVSFEVLLGK